MAYPASSEGVVDCFELHSNYLIYDSEAFLRSQSSHTKNWLADYHIVGEDTAGDNLDVDIAAGDNSDIAVDEGALSQSVHVAAVFDFEMAVMREEEINFRAPLNCRNRHPQIHRKVT